MHINAGLHDLQRLGGAGTPPRIPVDQYRENLDTIVERAATDRRCRRLILATTTPVDDVRHAATDSPSRFEADVVQYNKALRTVAAAHDVTINDLHRVVGEELERFVDDDGVHLTSAGSDAAAGAVAAAVEAELRR